MGNKSSSIGQAALNRSSLLNRYTIVSKDEQNQSTVVREKESERLLIIKELAFVDRSFYEKNLCRFNHFQEIQQCENVLNLTKVWSEQHSTMCSNTYKIFPMYEYSTVTLKDEMEARKSQNKHFEEDQLLGIIQSWVNAFNSQPPILVCPEQYFICEDGLLKLNNHDLFNHQVLNSYMKGVYYSFEKMENFQSTKMYQNDNTYLKQAVFSLGITLLSCCYLEDVS